MRRSLDSLYNDRNYRNNHRHTKGRHTGGSVSVFLIMILAFIFLFAAVLIDYARIAAANTQGERLVRAGIRSVMSAYDRELMNDYGLFAFGDSDADMLLAKVLSENLQVSGRSDSFNILPLDLDSSSLQWRSPLGRYEVFRQQINEDMKYKAPVDFALELAGKFKPISNAMGEASRTTELFGQLQPLYDQREAELDQMLKRRREAANQGRGLLQLIMDPPGSTISPQSLGSVSNSADIAAQYNDYVNKTNEDMNLEEGEYPRYSYQISAYLRQSAEVISSIQVASVVYRGKHNGLMEDARTALQEAQRLNESMKVIVEQAKQEGIDPGYESAGNWDTPDPPGDTGTAGIPDLRKQAESLLLSPSEITNLEQGLSLQGRAYLDLDKEVSGLPAALGSASGLGADYFRINSSVLSAARMTSSYIQDYGKQGVLIAKDAEAIESRRTSDEERKATEKQSKVKLGEAMDMLDKIRSLGGQAEESMERYDALRQYYEDNISLNAAVEEEVEAGGSTSDDPYEAGNSAMDDMDGIYGAMGSIMGGARDRLFQTEYSALYFQHFDVTGLVSLAGGGGGDTVQQLADQLDPHSQEMEYILYGFHNPAGNIAAAYGEIFAMRLAVRTMEGFIERASLGNPLAVTAAALLYGIEKAIEDMLLLSQKGSLPLSKYVPAQLTYRDHLRLFMVLHGSGERALSRMLALIRLNTGVDPSEKFTAVTSETTFGMSLWFLPGVIKALNYSGNPDGDIKGNAYVKEFSVNFSY
ncbi:hypothetical protein [Paenibacillus sp. sgz500958]|uniref:hypothetical protein n=1 Tax=Paenibacillus sp. sgz500958 TaxID=3242475 RepID=UPI0036D39D95